jgi:hypothetical protein
VPDIQYLRTSKSTASRCIVAVAGVVLVVHDLLHGSARAEPQGLERDLHQRQAVDKQDDIVAVVAVVGTDAQLRTTSKWFLHQSSRLISMECSGVPSSRCK